jgi:transcriptional regulator with XRE-family HTH domain
MRGDAGYVSASSYNLRAQVMSESIPVAESQKPPAAALVASRREIRRRHAIAVLAGRKGWNRRGATAAIDRGLELGLFYETRDDLEARVLVIEPPKRERQFCLTAPRLQWMLSRAGRGQSWLATQLGLKQPQVAGWLRPTDPKPIPRRHGRRIEELTRTEAGARLEAECRRVGLLQLELAEASDVPQPSLSEIMRGKRWSPEDQWTRIWGTLERAAAELAAAPPPPAEPVLTADELANLLADAKPRISQTRFARCLGVTPPVVSSWLNGERVNHDGQRLRGRKPIPQRFWRPAKEILAEAEPVPRRDRVAEAVTAALELVAVRPGILRTHLDRELERFGEDTVRSAIHRAIAGGDLKLGRTVVTLRSGAQREYAGGLYPAYAPVPEAPDRRLAQVAAVLAAVEAQPGRSARDVADRLRGVEAHAARAAVNQALHDRLVVAMPAVYPDKRGRRRIRNGLYVPEAAPAAACTAS